jgi:hypothetical protein
VWRIYSNRDPHGRKIFNIGVSTASERVPIEKPNLMVNPLPFEKSLDTPLFNYNDFIVIIFIIIIQTSTRIIPEI